MQRRLLEIERIGRKYLPPCYSLPEYLNRSHAWELAPQTLVVLFGGGEPHSVIRSSTAFVTEYEDNLVFNINREAAEHGASPGRPRRDRVEYELIGDDFARLWGERGLVQREKGRAATTRRHPNNNIGTRHGPELQILSVVYAAVHDLESERLVDTLGIAVIEPGIRSHFPAAFVASPRLRLSEKLRSYPAAPAGGYHIPTLDVPHGT